MTLPPLPVDATGYNIYLSDPSADPGSATRYATGITTTTWTLASAVPPAGVSPPSTASATVAPTVKPSGGGDDRRPPGRGYVLRSLHVCLSQQHRIVPELRARRPSWSRRARSRRSRCRRWPPALRVQRLLVECRRRPRARRSVTPPQITTPLFNLAGAAPTGGIAPPTTQSPTIAPTVSPTGGSPVRGQADWPAPISCSTRSLTPNGVESLPECGLGAVHGGGGERPDGHPADVARRRDGNQPLSV